MNIQIAKIPFALQDTTLEEFVDDKLWDCVLAKYYTFNDHQLLGNAIHYSVVQQCNFSNARLNQIDFQDTRFENCDFSNATFEMSALFRVQFVNCKFVGTKFINTAFTHVHFEQCMLTLSTFSTSKLTSTIFSHCTLTQLDIYKGQMNNVAFDVCNLNEARFENTSLKTVELHTSQFEVLHIEPKLLAGCKASVQQAIYFASLLGVNIE